MKRIKIITVLVFFFVHAGAQKINVIGNMVKNTFNQQVNASIISPFKVLSKRNVNISFAKKITSHLKNYSLLQLTEAYGTVEKIVSERKPVTFTIPAADAVQTTLQLVPNTITTPDFIITTKSGQTILNSDRVNRYYTGIANADPGSIAAISFQKNGIAGMYSANGTDNFLQPALPGDSIHMSVLYGAADMQLLPLNCSTADDGFPGIINLLKPQQVLRPTQSCKTVRVYVELTYGRFVELGSDINNATDYVLSLFNVVNTIYKNDGINLQISEIFIWNQPDLYTGVTSVIQHLSIFKDRLLKEKRYGNPIHADIAHSITSASYGTSATLGNITTCNNLSVAASTGVSAFDTFPLPSYSVYAFAHELGHQLGSPHTHSCLWPGGAIDNCAPTEGLCPAGPAPVDGGTIMSYCPSVNFLKGLGPLPAALIRSIIDTSSCLQTCNTAVCENIPVKGIKVSLDDSIVKLKWDNESPKYRVGIKPNTTHHWQYFEIVGADSLVIPKTICETYYECSIAAYCATDNQYGTNYIFSAGNKNALSTGFIYPGPLQVRNFCAGDSVSLLLRTDTNAFTYNWYIDGQLQPQFTTAQIKAYLPGKYSVTGIFNGCSYYSDTIKVNYFTTAPNFITDIQQKTVSFQNLSRCANRYLWTFGDGTGSTEKNPVHTYSSFGKYNVFSKAWDANGVPDSITASIILFDQLTDSLNGFSSAGYAGNSIFTKFKCQQVVYFKKDSLTNVSPAVSYSDNTNTQVSKNIVLFPKNGTVEIKLFPVSGYKTNDYKVPLISDTGLITGFRFDTTEKFALKFSKWGGVQFGIDSLKIGSIKPGDPGPFKLNAWNSVGVSFGQQGMHLLVNGYTYTGLDSVIFPERLKYLYFPIGSEVAGGLPAGTYVYGFEGALDKVRFSYKENDWTFSAYPAWQGSDTVIQLKTVCYGESFEGHTSPGIYYTASVTSSGCDSVTATYLTIAELLNIKDSITQITGNKPGQINLTVNGGTPPYRFNWSDGETTPVININKAGSYKLAVTDTLNCKKEFTYNVYFLPGEEELFRVLPNPSKANASVILQIVTIEAGNYFLDIYDIAGRQVQRKTLYISKGVNHIPFPMLYKTGTYLMKLNRGNRQALIAKAVIL